MTNIKHIVLLAVTALLLACAASPDTSTQDNSFSIAVIPDTQNYIDYTHQRNQGFVLDGQELFIAQMQDIAARDEVVFVAAVGDVWQHSSLTIDPGHEARGLTALDNPFLNEALAPRPEARTIEIPGAIAGYRILKDAGIPFGVAPGNHDYDAFWSAAGYPPTLDKPLDQMDNRAGDYGAIHIGGLDNFRSVFGNQGEFFERRDWYVNSYRGGANAAQVFQAGAYRFLHITLEMSPDDSVLRWAADVIRDYPNVPTIITTHDYLDARGRRQSHPILDLAGVDPEYHNSAEQVWEKLLSAYDQVFMVLSGHHHGQAYRVDLNHYDHQVHQLLQDYQGRGRAGLDAGGDGKTSLGDGWYRLLHFDMSGAIPKVRVQTWSSHYRKDAVGLASYADWYRASEQPDMDATEFVAADAFEIELVDFRQRFDKR